MPDRRSGFDRTLGELKRRHVLRILGAYIVSFWVVLQVADIVLPAMMAPNWVMMTLIGLGIAGAPVAAALAWFYDLTPDGIRKDAGPSDIEQSVPALGGRWVDYLIIAALVVILAFVLARPNPSMPGVGSSVAVLPFNDLGADQEDRYFGDGIAEAIMDRLAGIPGIRVAARTSSFALRDAGLDARAMAEQLGVETLLEGSVRRAGDQLRISARLVDGKSGTQVWSNSFGGTLSGVFELQDEISRAIAREMQIELDLPGLSGLATDDPEAYDIYLRGRDALRQRRSDTSVDVAIEHFSDALTMDPDFGLASAGLCRARWERYEITRNPALADEAMKTCRETETRYPDLVETQIAIGSLHLGTGRPDAAEQAFRAALRRESSNAEAHAGLARAMMAGGNLDTAQRQAGQAIELDPAHWRYRSLLGQILYMKGELEAATDSVRQAMRLEPDNPAPWNLLGAIYFGQAKFRLAGDAFEQSISRAPNSLAYSNAGTNYFYAGQFARAEAMFRRASEMSPGDPRMAGFVAWSIRAQPDREADAEPFHRAVIRTATERLAINVNDHEARSMLSMHLAALGHESAARGAIASLAELSQLDPNSVSTTGFAHYLLGNAEQAASAFDQALARGLPFYLLKADPRLKDAWTDPHFAALAARYQAHDSITQGDPQ